MKFFTYHQNNSGGSFIGPHYVIVRAETSEEADRKAEEHADVYFDGVDAGQDCGCCGDRWYRAYTGDDEPRIYAEIMEIPDLDKEFTTTVVSTNRATNKKVTKNFRYIP